METTQPSSQTASVYVICSTQFVFLSLGLMALNILARVSSDPHAVSPLAALLVQGGLGLFLIPLVWLGFATGAAHFCPPSLARSLIAVTGFVVTALVGLAFAFAIFRPA